MRKVCLTRTVGCDGGERYRVVHVEHAANTHAFGHAWAELIGT
jgi:hypothetical protein